MFKQKLNKKREETVFKPVYIHSPAQKKKASIKYCCTASVKKSRGDIQIQIKTRSKLIIMFKYNGYNAFPCQSRQLSERSVEKNTLLTKSYMGSEHTDAEYPLKFDKV